MLTCSYGSGFPVTCPFIITPDRRQSKTSILSAKVDKKSMEKEFLTAICRRTGDEWQSKTLFLAIVDPHALIVKILFDCRLLGVIMYLQLYISIMRNSI